MGRILVDLEQTTVFFFTDISGFVKNSGISIALGMELPQSST